MIVKTIENGNDRRKKRHEEPRFTNIILNALKRVI